MTYEKISENKSIIARDVGGCGAVSSLVKILPTISEVISIRLRWTAARLMFRPRIFMTA